MMGIPFDSEEAVALSKEIQETIYWGALKASLDVAKREGHYESFRGSPLSEGVFQFEMWGMAPSQRYDWEGLRGEIMEHGVRNSLLIANMPTASTSQILSNNECFEWFTSNIYTRRTISGEFPLVNRHLVKDLIALGLWNEEMRDKIILENGSVQNIAEIPQNLKDLYKTVWEIKQRWVIDHAAARAPFICQTQSMNLFFEDANFAKLTSAQFYAWEKGLKTGVYYTRTKASRTAIKGLGIDMSKHIKPIEEKTQEENLSDLVCSIDNPDDCLACGS
jgi:ribonucleoside-diphosphate reductase alpha chain